MANNQNPFIKSWTLLQFAREFGPDMFVGEFVNHDDGQVFNAPVFQDNEGKTTMVHYSSKQEKPNIETLESNYKDYEIGQLPVDPEVLERRKAAGKQLESYVLYKRGTNSWKRVALPV